MKKAVIYARVSSDLQKKEGTIQSQIEELKKQVISNNNTLVEEYIDDGVSGAQLDRPGMNKLREDLKKDKFEVVYFLNTDRIAREVSYQTIIIGEIIKYKKQIIINGKDYVNDPENKFSLTVLGAVSELERAKIIERSMRGRRMRIRNGGHIGSGSNTFGYHFHKKAPNSPTHYTVNNKQAEIVKFLFETYTNTNHGLGKICKIMEEKGFQNSHGKVYWITEVLKKMLKQEMYIGTRYYNLHKIEYENHKKKKIPLPREEWIAVAVPSIISKDVFNKAQKRLEDVKNRYQNPIKPQLFSNKVGCGYCGSSAFSYRRFYKDRRTENVKVYYDESYRCLHNYRVKLMHSKEENKSLCPNKEMRAYILEDQVWKMVSGYMLDENILSSHMEYFKSKNSIQRVEREIADLDSQIFKLQAEKKLSTEKYKMKVNSHSDYTKHNQELDEKVNLLKEKKLEILSKFPLLNQKDLVMKSLNDYCTRIKSRFYNLSDYDSKRSFVLEFINKVIFYNEKVEILGSVPITNEINLSFLISDKIPRTVRNVKEGRRTRNSAKRITLEYYVKKTNNPVLS